MSAPVLWYVHHQGAGHWRRALAVARHLDRPVVFASSARPPDVLAPGHTWLPLPSDAPGSREVTAGGRFHWVPRHHAGLLARHARLLSGAERLRPALAVVDVSVEVAVLLRTAGVPVIAVRLPGIRDDEPHRLGFGIADRVVMPVPEQWNLHRDLPRCTAVGLVSAAPAPPAVVPSKDVAVLVGRGGSRLDEQACVRLAADCPDLVVRVLGVEPGGGRLPANLRLLGRVREPARELAAAGVVVANCGLGTVSDVVTARRPLVVLPEERPFGEQVATGRALAGDAVVLDDLPGPGGWAAAVEAARALGAPALVADGAERFADLVESSADREERRAVVPA